VGHVKRVMNSCSALQEDRACKHISNSFYYLEGSNIPRVQLPPFAKTYDPFSKAKPSALLYPQLGIPLAYALSQRNSSVDHGWLAFLA
nr:hypothetical protein [Tanacetum cinerariifolium]